MTLIPFSFAGKKAIITGAGRGLGKHLVGAVVRNKGEVIAISRTKSNLDQLKSEFPSVETICVDLMDYDTTRKAVEPLPPVDILVNNAAINLPGFAMNINPTDFDKTMRCNVQAYLNVCQIIAQKMIQAKKPGSIVNVSSLAERSLVDRQALYGMSKASLGLMGRFLAWELGPHNIRVNNVCPGIFPSDMSKVALDNPKSRMIAAYKENAFLGRIGSIDEVANVVLFLMCDGSSFITGQSIFVDGGYSSR